MRNLKRSAVALLVAAAAIAPVGAATMVVAAEPSSQASPGRGGFSSVPAAKGRLKFKSSGPVCMCAEGLSERDIEQALARSSAEVIAGQDTGHNQTPVGGQEKNLNSGVAK
ncbi:MAG: hypothetical protein WCV99_17505 [Sterolibacterium sp.]|jgi:hypothetical protein